MPKVYCKYCYKYTRLVPESDLYTCEHCGAGLVPIELVKMHGSYKRYIECIEVAFGVMNEAIEYFNLKGTGEDMERCYPQCPHEKSKELHGLDLIREMRHQVGLQK